MSYSEMAVGLGKYGTAVPRLNEVSNLEDTYGTASLQETVGTRTVLHDFRHPPRSSRELRSPGLLRTE